MGSQRELKNISRTLSRYISYYYTGTFKEIKSKGDVYMLLYNVFFLLHCTLSVFSSVRSFLHPPVNTGIVVHFTDLTFVIYNEHEILKNKLCSGIIWFLDTKNILLHHA